MKFPAVTIAICLISGIAMGLWLLAANRALHGDFISANWLRRFS